MRSRKGMKKKSLYRLISTNIIIVMVVLILMIPIYLEAYDILKKNVAESSKNTLNIGLERLVNDLDNINHVAFNLQNEDLLKYMANIQGDIRNTDYIDMIDLQKIINDMTSHINIVYDSFVMFRNNNIVVGVDKVYDSANRFYPNFFTYNDMSYNDYKEQMMNIDNNSYLINKSKNTIMYMNTMPYKYKKYQSVLVSLIRIEDVIDMLADNNIIKDGFLNIYNKNGDIILSTVDDESYDIKYNDFDTSKEMKINNKKYTLIKSQELNSGYTVVMGISNLVFVKEIRPILTIINTYIVIAIIVGLIISLIFGYREYRPIKGLVQVASQFSSEQDNTSGELQYLKQVFLTTSRQTRELSDRLNIMKKQVEVSVFEKILNGSLLDLSVDTEINKYMPWLANGFIVITIKTKEYSSELTATMIEKYFTECSEKYKYYLHPSLHNYTVMVFACDTEQQLQSIIQKLEEIVYSNINNSKMVCGVSKKHNEYKDIKAAYEQAMYAMKYCNRSNDKLITSFESKDIYEIIFNIKDSRILNERLLNGDLKSIDEYFGELYTTMMDSGNIAEEHLKQFFYQVKGIIVSICRDLSRMDILEERKEYSDFTTIKEMINYLTVKCSEICNIINDNKKSRNSVLKDKIYDYVETNFNDPNLYGKALAEKFNISQKYLFNFIKEQTGRSLGEIIESKRLNYAVELIKTTDLTFGKIALKCGFNSSNTFYKAFKRVYGVTPGSMRKR